MHNLPLHGDKKQDYKVQQQDWPENRNIKNIKESHDNGNNSCTGARVPKLELRQTSCKWPVISNINEGIGVRVRSSYTEKSQSTTLKKHKQFQPKLFPLAGGQTHVIIRLFGVELRGKKSEILEGAMQ